MKPPQEGVAAHPPQNLYSSPVGVSLSPLSTLDLKGALGQEADRRLETCVKPDTVGGMWNRKPALSCAAAPQLKSEVIC